MPDIVECHSSFAYAEQPVAFHWNDKRYEISEVLKVWNAPDSRHFRVLAEDDAAFELVYLESSDAWQVIPR